VTYFQNHPQRYTQHRYPRRGGGYTAPQITLHTYEAPHTRSLQDAARWLTQRRDPGSYHALAGARGPRDVLLLAPWSHETWHSVPSNNWSIGISAVAYAHQWKTIPKSAADNLVKSMAYAASLAAKWLEQAHGRKVEPRVLTRAQAMRKESGFVTHATMDPGRRSDPGRDFPMADFLAEFKRLMNPNPTPERTWFDMATKNDLRDVVRDELNDLFNQRIKLTGSSKEAFGPDFRAGALLAYAARGGLTAHEPTVQAIGKLVGKSTSEILAAIAEANADVELPEDDDTTTDNEENL